MEAGNKYKSGVLWVLLAGIFILCPWIFSSDHQINLTSAILIWGLFAVSFNMLFGLTGMLSFGQALYYGVGAYSVGLMVHYLGANWYLPGMLVGMVVSLVLSLLLGFLVIRVGGVYFTMLTLAFAQLAWQVCFKLYNLTGGDDGMSVSRPEILGNHLVWYYFILVLVLASVWFLKRITYSPQGLMLRCVRQNPDRVRFLGRRVRANQIRVYIISSVFCSLAGGLMAGVDSFVHTDMLFWTTSGEVILMSVLGGAFQFFGPFVGATVIVMIEEVVGAMTEYWSLVIGTVMIVMVILFPLGLVGEFQNFLARLRGRGPVEG